MFSYQCSQLSTSESILNVFRQAETIQSKKDRNKFVSIVVLDEVGLAEDSPGLSLKILHPLLEDGTEESSYLVDVCFGIHRLVPMRPSKRRTGSYCCTCAYIIETMHLPA